MNTPARPANRLTRFFHLSCAHAALALLLAISAPLAQAQSSPVCFTVTPPSTSVVEGTAVDLVATATVISGPAPSPSNVTWNAFPTNVTFPGGSNSITEAVVWNLLTPGVWQAQVSQRVLVGFTGATTTYSASVFASDGSCTPSPASINVLPLSIPNVVMTSNGTPTPGANVDAQVFATHFVNPNTLSAVNVPFTFNISGPGTFGIPAPYKVVTDGGGFASIPINISNSATAGQSITVSASAAGYGTATTTITVVNATTTQVVVTSGDNQQLNPSQSSEPIVFELQSVIIRNQRAPQATAATVSILSGDAVITESGGSTASIALSLSIPQQGAFSIIAGSTPGPVVIGIDVLGTAPAVPRGYAYAEVLDPTPPKPLEIVSGNGQMAEVGQVLPQALVVRVPPDAVAVGAFPRAKQATTIDFRVISGQARFVANNQGVFQAPVDAGTGLASAQLQFAYEIGTVRIEASAPGYQPVVFNASAVAPGQVLELTRLSAPALGAPGSQSDPLVVQLTRSGVPVSDARIDWQVISGAATLATPDTQTDSVGHSQNALTFGTFAGDIVVRATHTPSDGTVSVSTDFTLAVPAQGALLSVSAGNGQSGPIGGTLDQPIEFWLHNYSGPIVGEIVNFSVTGAATLTAASATTDSEGKVRANLRFGGTAGAVTVTARAFGNQISASAVATSFVPHLTIVSGDGQSAPASAALPDPLVIGISQPVAAMLGKALGGLAVNWRVLCGNGTLTAASTQTDSFGHSQNRLTLGPSPGCNQVEAAIQGVGTVTFNATATVPAGTILEIFSGNGQALVPRADSAPLRVRARTPDGQNLAGIVIDFSADRSEATLNPTEATTTADGTASTIVRIGLPVGVRVTARIRGASAVAAVDFALNAGVVNMPNLGAGETGVAIAIDSACPRLAGMSNLTAGQADLLARCSELVGNAANHPSEVVRALGEMLGDEASSQNNAALAAAANQLDHLKSRFAALRSGSRGLDLAGLNLMVPGGAIPLSLLPSAIVLAVGEPPEEVGAEFSRWGFFATGTIGRGERDPDTLDPGYKYDSYDITAGVDYRATDSWVLGAALGFNGNDTRLPDARSGMDATGWTVSGYASWFAASQWYVDAVLSYGSNQFDLERSLDYSIAGLAGGLTRVDQIALASPDGDRQSFSVSLGRDFNKGAWSFGPYLRAAYTSIGFDGYSETMSNPSGAGSGLALQVEGRTLKSLQGVVGGKLSYAVSTSWGVLLPSAQIEWVNEFEDDPELLVTRFLHDPTQTPILIESDRIDDSYFNIGLGLSGVFASGRSAYLYYEHVAGQERMSSDSLAIGIRIEF